ncbi:MAG: OmpA family protein [Desulfobacterales bacterium]|nr:OmpA family protein [Desulfobacterales bacterium]
MMTKRCFRGSFLVLICALLVSCAAQKPQMMFQAQDLNPQLQAGHYVQKVDTFIVIMDASSTMKDPYGRVTKLKSAKEMVNRMNQTIPDLQLTSAFRTFGQSWCPFAKKTALVYGPTAYSKAGLEEAVETVKWASGKSPLALAIDAASDDLKSTQGKTAVIIVSDGQDMDNAPVVAGKNVKTLFGERLCIYTVLVGNDPEGKRLLEQVVQAGRCGFSVLAEDIASSKDMAGFVEKVFFERAEAKDSDGDGVLDDVDKCPNTPKGAKVDRFGCPVDTDGDGVYDYLDQCPNTPKTVKVNRQGCPLDTDGDGVYDYLDQCPSTPHGAKVNDKGCWVLERVQFDTGKWDIKPRAYAALDEVVAVLERNPTLYVEIEGHTDSVGAEAYNQKLSENRAKAVMEHLVKKGIQPERLSSAGYAFSRPIASNDTQEGRARNRRVELTPVH